MNVRSLHRGVRVLVTVSGLILVGGGLAPLIASEPPQKDGKQIRPSSQLRLQKLATRKAWAAYQIARYNREIAEIAVEEYRDVTYEQDLATVEGEIKLAESDLAHAEDRLASTDQMIKKGFVPTFNRQIDELNVEKAKYAVEAARSKRNVLVKYTRDWTIKGLESKVKKARQQEIEKGAAWERAVIEQATLELRVNGV